MFWAGKLPGGVPDDLRTWIKSRVEETQVHWQNVGWLSRSRGMFRELTAELEARDPTNSWTRQYERIYFESQLMTLTRMVNSKHRKGARRTSLTLLLKEFVKWPELLAALPAGWFTPDELTEAADPIADISELRRLIVRLSPWRDRAIAHLELDVSLPNVAWSELDDAIDGVVDVFRRYSLRLTGVRYQTDHDGPPWQDWQTVFMQPLFVDSQPE
jgi:hypothetical protein